jgi:hypothetical protein
LCNLNLELAKPSSAPSSPSHPTNIPNVHNFEENNEKEDHEFDPTQTEDQSVIAFFASTVIVGGFTMRICLCITRSAENKSFTPHLKKWD